MPATTGTSCLLDDFIEGLRDPVVPIWHHWKEHQLSACRVGKIGGVLTDI